MMEASARAALVIDIGGTNTQIAVVSDSGAILARESVPTASAPDFEGFMDIVCGVADHLIEEAGSPHISGVGAGAPAINCLTGMIGEATDLPWPTPADLAGALRMRLGLHALNVICVNDANAAAEGERLAGNARGCRDFIVLTLGTGVGAGVVADGNLICGSRGYGGELGHMALPFGQGRICSCGRTDCLQTYASASGVVETARRLLGDRPDTPSALRSITDPLSPKIIADLANAGDPIALETWRRTGHWLGVACANFAAATDPDMILFFGGVANAFPLFEESLKSSFEKHALHLNRDHVRFLPSAIAASDAALIGAAASVFTQAGA